MTEQPEFQVGDRIVISNRFRLVYADLGDEAEKWVGRAGRIVDLPVPPTKPFARVILDQRRPDGNGHSVMLALDVLVREVVPSDDPGPAQRPTGTRSRSQAGRDLFG